MNDLVTFLRARLDEDEHWAHMAEAGWPPENALAASEDPGHYAFMATDITPSKATFIRRHDPARVLRQVEAGRGRLALMIEATAEMDRLLADDTAATADVAMALGRSRAATVAVKWDAVVHNAHPDYMPEWKP